MERGDDESESPDPLRVADRAGRRAARLGFDWPDATGPLAKVREELEEFEKEFEQSRDGSSDGIAGELGDMLFSIVNLARHLDVDAGDALRGTVRRFERRFERVRRRARSRGREVSEMSLETLETLWRRAKREGGPE